MEEKRLRASMRVRRHLYSLVATRYIGNQQILRDEYKVQNHRVTQANGGIFDKKTCIDCRVEKSLSEFSFRRDYGRVHPCKRCALCEFERVKTYYETNPDKRIDRYQKNNARLASERKNPANRAKFIVMDSRRSDVFYERTCDVDVKWVETLISDGRFYCGDRTIMMTLDRIDNSLGHTKGNVNPSCYRCNWLRRNMPYEAWMHLVPSVREAVALGLFGNWSNTIRAAA
jgi:hypothetical protein